MKTTLWYSVRNGGDGSAYPVLMESQAQCEIDQRFMDEGWGEPCHGCFMVESEDTVTITSEVVTVAAQRKEVEDELNEDYMKEYKSKGKYPDWFDRLEGHLAALVALAEEQTP